MSRMWATTLVMFGIVLWSQLNHGSVTLHTNMFGEGVYEIVALYIIIVLGLLILIDGFKEAFR